MSGINNFSSNNNKSYALAENKMTQEESDQRRNSDGIVVQKNFENLQVILKKTDDSSFNHVYVQRDESKIGENVCNEDEEKETYMKRIEQQEKLKSDAHSYAKKLEVEKVAYMADCTSYFAQLHNLYVLIKLSNKEKEGVAKTVEALEHSSRDFLANWGPKRCLIYLKLASVYSKMENSQKVDMLSKAEEDLNEMSDAGDISECRRWLYLQRVESRMNNDTEKRGLNKEGILLDKCWNVHQRHFEGRRDFLDFYTIFWAKHLLRQGEYKKAEGAYLDALILRKQREKFWDQDDFDWKKLESEVREEIVEIKEGKN